MDLIVMVGGALATVWVSFWVGSRYPKHFAVFVLVANIVTFFLLKHWGKI